jgi:cysteine synthase A
MFARNIEDIIGHTPLLEMGHLSNTGKATVYAKAEFMNPGGSVKDRIALNMINKALEREDITRGATLIEATSGNTGIGLAMICASKGLDIILTMPESMSLERRKLLEHLGAKIVLTPAGGGMSASIQEANRLASEIPNSFLVRQFDNPDNPQTHYHTTAEEILEDAGQNIDIFIAGVGTGGTITGVGTRLKEINPNIQIIAVEPDSSAVLNGQDASSHGIQGIGAGFVPDVLDTNILDTILKITDEDAVAYAKNAARQAGLLVGISSGANLAAAHQLSRQTENAGKIIVTILPDTAERYLSTSLFK